MLRLNDNKVYNVKTEKITLLKQKSYIYFLLFFLAERVMRKETFTAFYDNIIVRYFLSLRQQYGRIY